MKQSAQREEKTFYMANYKGKYFVIQDELLESDHPFFPIEKITKKEALEPYFCDRHIQNCIHYGIPAYLGKDKDMLKAFK